MKFLKYYYDKQMSSHWVYFIHNNIIIRFDPNFVVDDYFNREIADFESIFFNNAHESWSGVMSREDAIKEIESFGMIEFVKFHDDPDLGVE